jgi:hypothetical protein
MILNKRREGVLGFFYLNFISDIREETIVKFDYFLRASKIIFKISYKWFDKKRGVVI